MPSLTITSSGNTIIPSGVTSINAQGRARGGRGGAADGSTPGGGGGQGGSFSLTNVPVPADRTIMCTLTDTLTALEVAVAGQANRMEAYHGGDAIGMTPGSGGGTLQTGFGGKGSGTMGSAGSSGTNDNGGCGGGGTAGGTTVLKPTGGSYGTGGGGQGAGGPPFSESSPGGPGGSPIIMLDW